MSHTCEAAATLFVVILPTNIQLHQLPDTADEKEVLLGKVHACICEHQATELQFIAEFRAYICIPEVASVCGPTQLLICKHMHLHTISVC